MTILRSTGPVISTRRSSRSLGTGAMRQSAARTAAVPGRKSGSSPASQAPLALRARLQQLQAPRIEAPVQARQQLQRKRRQHLVRALDATAADLNLRFRRVAGVHPAVF